VESLKIAIFCWESLYAERVGGLASAATHLAETLAKHHEVHYFTRGQVKDQTISDVNYHYCQPQGNNIVEYCDSMSRGMVENFQRSDKDQKFDYLHFNDWHAVQALHVLQDRNTILTYHSTEYGRNGNQYGDWWEYKEISGKEWYGGLIAKKGYRRFGNTQKRGHASLQRARMEMRRGTQRDSPAPVPCRDRRR